MKSGDVCKCEQGRMLAYKTRTSGEHRIRYLRCTSATCTERGKEVLKSFFPTVYQTGTNNVCDFEREHK